jgi:hypothetical protein
MTIKIEITGDDMGHIAATLHTLIRPDALTLPLTDLWKIVQERFGVAGFVVTATAQGDVPGTPALPPEDKPTPAEAAAIVEGIEKALATKAPRKKASAKTKDPVPDPAAAAESIKNYVVGEMIQRFGDPRQKLKAKAFIDQVTGRHGGVRLSLLDPALFPDIKVEMEEEFGIVPANGSGGEAHA